MENSRQLIQAKPIRHHRILVHTTLAAGIRKRWREQSSKDTEVGNVTGMHTSRLTIYRRMIACAMAKHDTVKARQTFNQMPQSIRDAPLTRFLLFKVALKDRDTTLGM